MPGSSSSLALFRRSTDNSVYKAQALSYQELFIKRPQNQIKIVDIAEKNA